MVSFPEERQKMANQNAMLAETINMALTAPSIFSKAVQQQKPPVAPCGGVGVGGGGGSYLNRKKVLQNLDTNAGTRPNCWVESIRASSPTHMRSLTPSSLIEEKRAWMIHHPSALDMFPEIIEASKGRQIVMFLDYDGTLSPIVENPDRAFMSSKMRKAVRSLAKFFPTAIVTGRCRDKVYDFVKLAELYYAGSHGMDIQGPTKGSETEDSEVVNFQAASEFLPLIDEVYQVLIEETKSTLGARVEHNKFCVSVHFRCVAEKKWSELAQKVKEILNEYPQLIWKQGRMVMEIRPKIEWDKGKALEFLLESLGYADCTDVFPVYIGDDTTDEDAFKILKKRGQGFGILVSKFPKKTNASYSLQEPKEVMDFLQKLVRWKKGIIG